MLMEDEFDIVGFQEGFDGKIIHFFLNQPIKNNAPIKNAGTSSIRDIYQGSIVSLIIEDTICATPARMKATPPTISYFQDMNKTSNKTSEGILWRNKSINISLKLDADSKTSRENIPKKAINIIDRIRGVQYMNLEGWFIIVCIGLIKVRGGLHYLIRSVQYTLNG